MSAGDRALTAEEVRRHKVALRRRLRQARAAIPDDLRMGWSAAIRARLAGLDVWRDAERVHLFIGALPGEVETLPLLRAALSQGKVVVAPRVLGEGRLGHYVVEDLSQLARSSMGLLEPDPGRAEVFDPLRSGALDVVATPLVAWSRPGDRLGLGGGYYDRFLRELRGLEDWPAMVGVAFECQVASALPIEPGDERLTTLVTECGMRRADPELEVAPMSYEVKLVRLPARRIAALREDFPMEAMSEAFARVLPAAHEHLSEQGGDVSGHVVAVYHEFKEATADVSAGQEVPDDFAPKPPLQIVEVPAGEAAQVDHYGPYQELGGAHDAIREWMAANGRESSGPPLERYITDPMSEPDPSKWLTEAVWPLK